MPRRLVCLVLATACDDHLLGVPVGDTDAGPPAEAYSCDWAGVQDLFHDRCDGCHAAGDDGEPGSGGFVLVEAITEELADGDDTNNHFVLPGDADGSLLWQSLSGTGTALLMPYGNTSPLDPAITQHVACWITDGAPL